MKQAPLHWGDCAWLLVLGVASSIWCVTAASRLSATFDEPFYIEKGLESWRTGSYYWLMRAGTMPLPVDVQTLPLYLWEQWRGIRFDPVADFDRLLPVARACNLIFWWLLLFFGMRIGRLFGGPWGGRFAVAMLACEPSLLSHAALATTDISVSACLLGFLYYFWTGRDQTWWRRVGLPTLWYALAVLAKASAFVFGPLFMIVLELHRFYVRGLLAHPNREMISGSGIGHWFRLSKSWLGHLWAVSREFRKDFWKIFLLGLVLVFAYCGTDFEPQRSFVKWAKGLPEGTVRDVTVGIAQQWRIFPNAGEALMYQIKHNFRGHGVYLFGDWHRRAVPHYFPVLLTIKLTVLTLGILVGLLLLNPRTLFNPLGVVVVALLLFSLNCRVQIGIRLIFPLVVLLLTLLAVGLAKALETGALRRWLPGVALILVGVGSIAPGSSWPDGLVYINPLWGGAQEGYRHVADSNYDWGQGLQDLDEWRQQTNVSHLRIWYYGADPQHKRRPEFIYLHILPLKSEAEVLQQVQGSMVAVGASILHNNPELSPSAKVVLEVLRQHKPVARTRTFFIFDFTETNERRTAEKSP